MKKEKLYLAGPMTGYPNYNWDEFKKCREHLRNIGFEVVCPAEMTDAMDGQKKFVEDQSHMQKVINEQLKKLAECTGIVLMKGWQNSVGSKKELLTALNNNLKIYLYEDL